MASSSEELQSVETELIELKRCMQALEIELQSELSLVRSLICYYLLQVVNNYTGSNMWMNILHIYYILEIGTGGHFG